MPNPQYDFTSQYISQSYGRVVQIGNGSNILNGYGDFLFDYNSFILTSQTSSMNVQSASYAVSASWAPSQQINTSSFVTNNQTSSMSVLSSSYATTASYALNGGGGGAPDVTTSQLLWLGF